MNNAKPLIYFRTYAKEHGCENVKELGDLAVWNWIREYQKITVWKRLEDKAQVWGHNHISKGYDDNTTKPTPMGELQKKSWGRATWKGTEARLTCYHEVLAPWVILK